MYITVGGRSDGNGEDGELDGDFAEVVGMSGPAEEADVANGLTAVTCFKAVLLNV